MIPPRVALWAGLAAALAPLPAGAEGKNTYVTTAFSQVFHIALPSQFEYGYEDVTGESYILELVPKGEKVEDWTELVTLTALKDRKGVARLYAESIVDGFAKACPGSFAHAELDPPRIEGAKVAALFYASCGDLGGYSESVVFLTLDGKADAYSVQIAERSMPQATPIDYHAGYWAERVALLAGATFTAK